MRLGASILLAAVAALALAAATAAGLPGPAGETPLHRLDASGLVTGDPAPEFLSDAARDHLPGEDHPPVPAEAVLQVGTPVDYNNGELGPREAQARLILRPTTAYAAHPMYDDVHSPTFIDFTLDWTKEAGWDDPADATGWRTATWNVTLAATVLDEPLELSGAWTPASVRTVCTADFPPSYCVYEGAGPVHLEGSWGTADVTLDGAASDRFCTYADAGGVAGYVERTADSC